MFSVHAFKKVFSHLDRILDKSLLNLLRPFPKISGLGKGERKKGRNQVVRVHMMLLSSTVKSKARPTFWTTPCPCLWAKNKKYLPAIFSSLANIGKAYLLTFIFMSQCTWGMVVA